jgi:hypothetical protein
MRERVHHLIGRVEEVRMIVFHAGEDFDLWTQPMKHVVVFVRFNDEQIAVAQPSIGPCVAHHPTHDIAWIAACLHQNVRDH